MANENTVGAPTEGLGQTVTFGFQTPRETGSNAVQRGGIRGTVRGDSGGGVTQARGGIQFHENPTMDLLLQVGASFVDKKIKETRAAAFVSGMQRAMTGEAVDDIARDQPAWSRVFGDTDAVEGARSYQAETSVQKVMLDIEEQMPKLREMPPEAAKEFFTKSVTSAMTGHAATDGAILGAISRNLPSVMKRQATAHYAFMQERAAGEEANALDVAATRLQNAGMQLADGILTEDDFNEQAAAVGALSVPAIGRDLEWVQKQRTASAVLMAENGQFHALNAMQKVGMLDLLTPQQKAQVQRSRDANELQWRTRFGMAHAERIAALKNLAERPTVGVSGEYVMSAVRDLNADYKKRTGSASDYFDPNIIAAYGERTAQAIAAAQDQQQRQAAARANELYKAGDAANAAKAETAVIETAMANGTLGQVTAVTSISAEKITREFAPRVLPLFTNALGTPAEAFDAVARSAVTSRYTNGVVADRIRGMVIGSVSAGQASDTFANTFEGWRKLNSRSPEAAAMYYGEFDAKFRQFALLHPGPINPKAPDPNLHAAFATSFGDVASSSRGKLGGKAEMAELTKALTAELTFKMPEAFGGRRDLNTAMASALAEKVRPFAEAYGKIDEPEAAMKQGLARAMQLGLNVVGGYFWQDAERPSLLDDLQKRLGSTFALPTGEEFGQHVGDEIDELISKAGGMDTPHIIRSGDLLVIRGYKDGKQNMATIEYNALAERIRDRATKARGDNKPWYRMGPDITYTDTNEKSRSIYKQR